MPRALLVVCLLALGVVPAWADVTRLRIERREVILNGKAWGGAGTYEKLIGKVDFALDPTRPQNQGIVDLNLAPKNAQGLVEFSADFFLLKPVDPARGNGRLFYEAGNRGTMRILSTFQGASNSADPSTEAEFGNGTLMNQGFTMLWMGWQWDVPQGRMRMEIPIATDNGRPITGWVRGNFIPGRNATTALIADRGHTPYPVVDPGSAEHRLLVRTIPTDTPAELPRSRWRFTGPGTVTLDGGFEPGLIYDVIYRARDPRVVGVGLAGTRDIVSFFKYADAARGNPMPGLRHAIGWGVSQTGRFLRHFVYQGFNEDERGRQVFDGVFDQVGGAGRGSFNHRFGQQSRDQLQHFNILYPVDMFPFTDEDETDPETGLTDGLLARARRTNTVPKFFHVLTDSEYFNRAGSLTHTDVTGTRDIEPPPTSRVYFIASAPHIVGAFPPAPFADPDFIGQADMNPLVYTPVIRALFRALDAWVVDGKEPPGSRFPRLSDGTLTTVDASGWPAVPRFPRPTTPMTTYRLDFGPEWAKGIVTIEPPKIGKPFIGRVPAVDEAGNDRAGIRLPEISVPLATHTGWNYRHPSIGSPMRLASEIGSYLPLPRTKADRERTKDGRRSIEERYAGREEYLGRITAAAAALVGERFLLQDDVADVVRRAATHFDWAVRANAGGEIRVMTSGAFAAAHLELSPRFAKTTGDSVVTVTTSTGVGADSIASRITRGEAVDVVILPDAALEQLIKDDLVVAGSRVPLARSAIGMAVRAGAPKPDIGSVDALRRVLLQAKSVAYSASVSGEYLSKELFPSLGIADQMRGKSQRIERERVGAVVARGEAEIGFQQITELLEIQGISYVGPLPAAVQRVTLVSAGVAKAARNPEGARALIQFFAAPDAQPTLSRVGLEPLTVGTKENAQAGQSIEGRWKLIAAEDLRADGSVARYPWGRSPIGSIVAQGGHCYVQIMSSDVPAFAREGTAVGEQMKAALLSTYIAYSGPCAVNQSEGSVTLKVEAAWRPDYVGTEQKRFFRVEGGRMSFGPAPNSMRSGSETLTRRLTLERVTP